MIDQVQETIEQLQALLAMERTAVTQFDLDASARAAERKLELHGQLHEQLLACKRQGVRAPELREPLQALQRDLESNHVLLGFAQNAVRGALAALTNTPAPTVYNPHGTLAVAKSSLMNRVV